MKGWAKVKDLFWYSDSEPNEVLIAFCHVIVLPLAIIGEFENPSILAVISGMLSGVFQLWAVVWNGTLKYRLIAVQLASLIAIMTIVNLYMEGLLKGSRIGWCIIGLFAFWNTLRVFKEKINKNA
jgi:hypothetical protein